MASACVSNVFASLTNDIVESLVPPVSPRLVAGPLLQVPRTHLLAKRSQTPCPLPKTLPEPQNRRRHLPVSRSSSSSPRPASLARCNLRSLLLSSPPTHPTHPTMQPDPDPTNPSSARTRRRRAPSTRNEHARHSRKDIAHPLDAGLLRAHVCVGGLQRPAQGRVASGGASVAEAREHSAGGVGVAQGLYHGAPVLLQHDNERDHLGAAGGGVSRGRRRGGGRGG